MPLGFWQNIQETAAARGEPFFVLAPMADVTDVPFRSIVAECGRPNVFYTEFISAHGLASPGRDILMRDLALTSSDHPIVAQFFGTNPEHMRAAGALALKLGFDGVDVNMGCPDAGVMKQGAGIAMVKTPALATKIIAALREGAPSLPVAVKTRLGLYRVEEMGPWISTLLSAKPDVLIIHGRTMKEASKVPAHWDLIGRVAQMCHDVNVLCIGNGDVMTRERGIELAHTYGVDGIMVGRGIFHNPWLFNPAIDPGTITPQQRLALLLKHTDAFMAHWGSFKSFALMKKFYKIYVSGWPGAAELRTRLMECRTADEVHASVEKYHDYATV